MNLKTLIFNFWKNYLHQPVGASTACWSTWMVIFTTTMMKILYYVFAFQLYSQEFYAKQTKQNKRKQKKYTLLLELLQSGFEDYATTSIHSCDNLSGHQWQQTWIHLQSFWQFWSFCSWCHGLSSPPLEVEKFNGKHKDGSEENSPANQHSCDYWEEAVFESKARVDVICDCLISNQRSYNFHFCGYITKLWHNQTIDCPSHWTYPVVPNPPCWNLLQQAHHDPTTTNKAQFTLEWNILVREWLEM